MAITTPYNERIRNYGAQLVPQTFAPVPQLQMQPPEDMMQQMGLNPQQTQAPQGPSFPSFVQQAEQSKGKRLTQPELDSLRDRFLIEQVRQREWGKKGAKKGQVDAAEGAFTSKADRWIQDYLKNGGEAGAEGDDKEGAFDLYRSLIGTKDAVLQGINTATLGTVSGLANLEDYKQRLLKAGLYGTYKLITEGSDAAGKEWDKQRSTPTIFADVADKTDAASQWIKNEVTSEETLAHEQHLQQMWQDGAPPEDILKYIGKNASALAPMAGQALGFMAPAFGLGLAGKAGQVAKAAGEAGEATGLISRLAQGGRASRFASKVLEQTPAAVASGLAPSGQALGQLRQQINAIPLDQLVDSSPRNKELYESFAAFGLKGSEQETAFRNALFNEAQDSLLAGQLTSNIASAALLGSPVERSLALAPKGGVAALAGKQAEQSLLRRMLGGAAHEAFEETAASVPDTISQNLAVQQYTGQPQDLGKGGGTNALLSGILGGLFGGTIGARKPRVAAPVAETGTDTEGTGTTNTPPPTTPAGSTGNEAPPASPTAGITTNTGTGIEDKEHKAIVGRIKQSLDELLGTKKTKESLKKADASGVLAMAVSVVQDEAGDSFDTMTAEQRLSAVEAAAGKINKIAKADGVGETLQAIRNSLAQPTATPPGSVPQTPVAETPAQAAPVAPQATPPAAPPVTETPAPTAPAANTPPPAPPAPPAPRATLPKELAGAKPRYGNQNGMYLPQFESDIDKAFYIIGQKTKSKSDAKYRQFLVEQGYDEKSLDGIAAMVRSHVAAQVAGAPAGTNTSPTTVRIPTLDISKNTKAARPVNPLARSKTEAKPAQANEAPAGETKPVESKPVEKKKNPLKKAKPAEETKKPEKKNPLKKAKPAEETKPETSEKPARPKADAPAKSETPGRKSKTAPKQESVTTARKRIAPDLEGSDASDVDEGLALAREGDISDLNETLKRLVADEELTREQAAQLREAGHSATPSERGEGAKTNEKLPTEKEAEAEGDSDQANEPIGRTDKERGDTLRKLFVTAVGSSDPQRASTLLRRIAMLPETKPFQSWLANKLANALEKSNLDIQFLSAKEIEDAKKRGFIRLGGYFSNAHVLRINPEVFSSPDFAVMATLHEALHAVTANLLKATPENATVADFQNDMSALLDHVREYVKKNPDILDTEYLKAIAGNAEGPLSKSHELLTYALTDPRWMEVLSKIPAPGGSRFSNVWEAFKTIVARVLGASREFRSALEELIEQTGRIVDYDTANPDVSERARDNIAFGRVTPLALPRGGLDTNSRAAWDVSDALEPVEDMEGAKQKLAQKMVSKADVAAPSTFQRILEVFALAQAGLEKAESLIRKAGGLVNDENSPSLAGRLFSGHETDIHLNDIADVVEPLRNLITKRWKEFKVKDPAHFKQSLDIFFQNRHALTRNKSVWSERVELSPIGELKRNKLLEDGIEGKLTGNEVDTKLIQNAERYGKQTVDDWARANPQFAANPEKARKALDKVAKLGFTDANLKDFDAARHALVERTRQRNIAAGRVATDDPFATRSWNDYVPLKGSLFGEGVASYDYGDKAEIREFYRNGLKTLRGRNSPAANVFDVMLKDLTSAGTEEARGEFKSRLYQYVIDNKKLLGATVDVWKGIPKGGFRKFKNGKPIKGLKFELPNPKYGFVYSPDGRTHYVVNLPKGSQLDRGVKGFNKVVSPHTFADEYKFVGKALQTVGAVTNMMARMWTVFSPAWQLTRGFVRDLQTIPTMVGAQQFDSPWKARRFYVKYGTNLIKNLTDLHSIGPQLKAVLTGDESTLRKIADDPKNAKTLIGVVARLSAAGGNTHYAQSMNLEKANDLLFGKAEWKHNPNALGGVKLAYKKYSEITSAFASFLENIGRASAFQALLDTDPNMTERKAAGLTKGALDFSQSGEWGKNINALHAYYRVGATELDAHRRAFTTKDGKFDKLKAAKWYAFMAAMGAFNYTLFKALLGKDDDGVDRIKKLSPETLTQVLPIPTGDNKLVGLSIGLGMPQLTLSPGMLGAAVAQGDMSPEDAVGAYYKTILRNIPLQPTGWKEGTGVSGFLTSWGAGLLSPTAATPALELATNTNAFGGPIHREIKNKNKFESDQAMPNTSEGWTDIATTLREMTGIDVYPETIKHIVQTYGGQPIAYLLRNTIDYDNRQRDGSATTAVRETLRLGIHDEDFYYRNQARDVQKELMIAVRMREHADDKDKWLRDNPDGRRRIDALKELNKALDAYFKEKNNIRANKLLATQGRIDKNKLNDSRLRQAVDKAKAVVENTEL
jgi:hypothetical protein